MAHTIPPTADFRDRRITTRRASDMPDVRLLRLQDVLTLCALSRTSIYDAIKNHQFPAPIHIHGRCTRWVSKDVHDWLATRIQRQRTNAGQPR